MTKNNSQKGFAMPIVIAIVALVVIIAGIGYFATRTQPSPTAQAPTSEKTLSDGTVVKADGTMVKTDGTMVKPDGTMIKPDGTMVKPDGTMVKTDGTMEKPEAVMAKLAPTGYVSYSSQAYADAKDQKRVLFFHAAWCPICKVANQDLTANASRIPSNVIVFKTDYDTETALKTKYGVTYQHTFVQVDAAGNAVTKWNGGGIDEILKNVK